MSVPAQVLLQLFGAEEWAMYAIVQAETTMRDRVIDADTETVRQRERRRHRDTETQSDRETDADTDLERQRVEATEAATEEN